MRTEDWMQMQRECGEGRTGDGTAEQKDCSRHRVGDRKGGRECWGAGTQAELGSTG